MLLFASIAALAIYFENLALGAFTGAHSRRCRRDAGPVRGFDPARRRNSENEAARRNEDGNRPRDDCFDSICPRSVAQLSDHAARPERKNPERNQRQGIRQARAGGQLGAGGALVQKVQGGSIQAAQHSLSNSAPFALTVDLINMPYLCGSNQRFTNLVNSDYWNTELHPKVDAAGFKALPDVFGAQIMFVGLIALAVPVLATFGAAAITVLVMFGDLPLSLDGESPFTGSDAFALTVVPLFILTGDALVRKGRSLRLLYVSRSSSNCQDACNLHNFASGNLQVGSRRNDP